jgi:hypothetical protein
MRTSCPISRRRPCEKPTTRNRFLPLAHGFGDLFGSCVCRLNPACAAIIAAVQNVPTGLAIPLPVMSKAEPWIGSNIEGAFRSGFKFAVGAMPSDPASGPRSGPAFFRFDAGVSVGSRCRRKYPNAW